MQRSITETEFEQLLNSHELKWKTQLRTPDKVYYRGRQMHIVSPQLRKTNNKKMMKNEETSVYDPVMVSLGPYHHGKQEYFSRAEEFKRHCLHLCAQGMDTPQTYLYDKIFKFIDNIRDCYAEVSIVNQYDDQALALMMLLDSCFILNFMENCAAEENSGKSRSNCLGVAEAVQFTARDIMVLENQIPFFVLELLIYEKYTEEDGSVGEQWERIGKCIKMNISGNCKQTTRISRFAESSASTLSLRLIRPAMVLTV